MAIVTMRLTWRMQLIAIVVDLARSVVAAPCPTCRTVATLIQCEWVVWATWAVCREWLTAACVVCLLGQVALDRMGFVCCKCFLADGGRLIRHGFHALHTKLLIASCRDLGSKSSTGGLVLLSAAIRHRYTSRTGSLVEAGADVNAVDEDGQSSVHWAVLSEAHGCLGEVIAARADVNRKDLRGSTALHYACARGNASATRLLVRAGADVDALNDDGHSSLVLAVRNGKSACVRALVGDSALDLAGCLSALRLSGDVYAVDCTVELLDCLLTSSACEESAKRDLLKHYAAGYDAFPMNSAAACFVLLACDADATAALGATTQDAEATMIDTYRRVLRFVDDWRATAIRILSDEVRVDMRIGRRCPGLYDEPLERVLEYLGLCATTAQNMHRVVIIPGDRKESTQQALLNSARAAFWWYKRYLVHNRSR